MTTSSSFQQPPVCYHCDGPITGEVVVGTVDQWDDEPEEEFSGPLDYAHPMRECPAFVPVGDGDFVTYLPDGETL